MIPKKIHYCWFGKNPKSDIIQECIDSWKKFCPDYEIIEWNEENFDISGCQYAREAYESKKWAFVSDYARIWILYHEGGVYFDTDVEVIKPIDPLLENKAFMGFEHGGGVNTGLVTGSEAGIPFFKKLINFYEARPFIKSDGSLDMTTCVTYTTELLKEKGLKEIEDIQIIDSITIYPVDYFCPLNQFNGQLNITGNSFSIHKYDGAWAGETVRYGYHLKWEYISRFGVGLGKFLYLFPYSIYILKNDGWKAFFDKLINKLKKEK